MQRFSVSIVSSVIVVLVLGLTVSAAGAQAARSDGLKPPGVPQAAVGSGFTYQGQLKQNSNPVNATCDFKFSLWDDANVGTQIGSTQTVSATSVSNGVFTVLLNGSSEFGAQPFNGEARYLQIAVRCPAGGGAFTTLNPRQPLSPAPYAHSAINNWALGGNGGTDPSINYIGTTDGQPLVVQPAGGYVGIGTTAPQSSLNVVGTSWFQGDSTPLPASAGQGVAVGFGGDQGYIFGFDYGTFTSKNLLLQNPGGNVGIGTLSPTAGKLHVDGGSTTAVYATSTSGIGTYAVSGSNAAVYGYSTSDYGVDGRSFSSIGVYGQSYSSGGMWGVGPYIGVQGNSTGSDANRQAVRGDNNGSATGYAGLFYGNTWVAGTFYKNAGAFRIDHPLDPANKYLNHSFVESPDMKNLYDGVITTDAQGLATVELPAWFEALNRDFRYQLTVVGQFAQAIIRSEIKDNRFVIQTDKPLVKVSWQVTGIRHDPYAEQHRISVEQDKPKDARGKYVYPEGYDQPHALSIPGQLPAMQTLAPQPAERTNVAVDNLP
jgi:hypothetical protein